MLSILVLQICGSFLLVALEGTSRHKALMDVTLRLLHLITGEIRLRVHPELLAIWERHRCYTALFVGLRGKESRSDVQGVLW